MGDKAKTIELEEGGLLDEATRNTGLSDFGDDEFREGLRVLLESLEGEARLNDFGRAFARGDILRNLENRLRVTEDLKRHPEILDVEIVEPIIIVSLPRTGSTILHHLMAQDPDNRYVATWECNLLSPPPESSTWDSDPRIGQWERVMAGALGSEVPEFETMHPMGARLAEECLTLMAFDFKSQLFNYQFNVPSYELWLEEQDLLSVYATHRRLLQYLQWHCPRKRWVLKAVGHLWGLKEIFEIYPDARLVQTHRDPVRVIGSLTSLMTLGLSMSSDQIDSSAIGEHWATSWVKALAKTIAFRDSGAVPEDRFFDVHYELSVSDPVGMVGEVYSHFGIEFSDVAKQRMTDYLALNPKDKLGAHRYTLKQFGLDPGELNRRYQFYVDRFDVACERTG
ncbi:MAG: sulfotransferase [Deltaproteobacteria bacterium]|nr:sulfotransferase [Deltaproteobacteria bacterium]